MSVIKLRDLNNNWVTIPNIPGKTGKSAYQQASSAGYSKSEDEFKQTIGDIASTGWVIEQGYTHFSGNYNDLSNKPITDTAVTFGSNNLITSNAVHATITRNDAPTPYKGQIITMNLGMGTRQYRVLKTFGDIVEVMCLFNYLDSCHFGSSTTYKASELDVVLNNNFYNSLSDEAKQAIVPKDIIQYNYFDTSDAYDDSTHASYADYSTKGVVGGAIEQRHAYALDIEDIEQYFGGTAGSVTSKTPGVFSTRDVLELLWDTTDPGFESDSIWLRSARNIGAEYVWVARRSAGFMYTLLAGETRAVRPAFLIDCSKIAWKPFSMPTKGQLISMNLGNGSKIYRVLKTNKNIAHVVSMYDYDNYCAFGDDVTYTNSTIDKLLNETFYNSLSDFAKQAIVSTDITQYMYAQDTDAYDATTHASYLKYSTKAIMVNTGNRYVYTLDVEDIEEYFGGTAGSIASRTPGEYSQDDLQRLFWGSTADKNSYTNIWLRSGIINSTNSDAIVDQEQKLLTSAYYGARHAVRPAMQIDLAKMDWEPIT